MDVFSSSALIIAASGTGFCRKYSLVTLPRQVSIRGKSYRHEVIDNATASVQ